MSRSGAELMDAAALEDSGVLAQWRRLAEVRANPFLTPEWYRAWTAAGEGEEPFPIVWRRDGEVRGVLPLIRARSGPIRVLRFAGSAAGDWFGAACDPEEEVEMAASCAALLTERRRDWHLLQMDRVGEGGAWPEALWEAGEGRILPARPREEAVYPYIRFDDGGYDGYLAARSRNFRSQLGRRRRRLEREHGLEFRMTNDPGRLEQDLETFFELHEERWRERGGSMALPAGARAAQRRFAAVALERGWLRLWTAEVDGRPGASWYGWRIGGRYCYALAGLRAECEPLALGTVLLAHTIEQAAAEGAEIYDMMRGDEPYKRRFETGRRGAQSWVLGRRGHPLGLAQAGADRLAGWARGLPPGLRGPLKRAYRTVRRS